MKAPARGDLVALSGMDGSGKTTQLRRLMVHYSAGGHPPVYLWTRIGYTAGFTRLKGWLRRLSGDRLPQPGMSEQRGVYLRRSWIRRMWVMVGLLDLMWVYGIQVRLWRRGGRAVICDRYLWDSLVDLRLNFPAEDVEHWLWWRLLRQVSPRPDAGCLLMISPEESMRRSQNPDKQEPFPDPPEVRIRRYEQYLQLQAVGVWAQVIDASQPCEAVWAEICQELPSRDQA